MVTVIAFAASAGLLALGRSLVIESFNSARFPTGTLVVNASGSLAAAVILSRVPQSWATVTGVAALGAFTTFSTFAAEVAALWETPRRLVAVVYVLCTTASSVGAAFIGLGL